MKPHKPSCSSQSTRFNSSSTNLSAIESPTPLVRSKPRKKPRSDACAAIHSAASGLLAAGVIDKTTMREFDSTCLVAPNMNAEDVKRIRLAINVSQEVFARYLGTNKSTLQKWESAANQPNPMAQRLLKVIENFGLDALA